MAVFISRSTKEDINNRNGRGGGGEDRLTIESFIHRTTQTTVEPIENDLDNHMDRRITIFFISKTVNKMIELFIKMYKKETKCLVKQKKE